VSRPRKKKVAPLRATKEQTDLTYGLFEAAANACGMSLLDWFPPSQRQPATEFAAGMFPERYSRPAKKSKRTSKKKKKKRWDEHQKRQGT